MLGPVRRGLYVLCLNFKSESQNLFQKVRMSLSKILNLSTATDKWKCLSLECLTLNEVFLLIIMSVSPNDTAAIFYLKIK